MRTIRISEEVWQAIAARGKFGETENDVLERIFEIQKEVQQPMEVQIPRPNPSKRNHYATERMSAEVRGKYLHVSFEHGPSNKWELPDTSNKMKIREVRNLAVKFAKLNGASYGQEQAVKKALTSAGYWLAK